MKRRFFFNLILLCSFFFACQNNVDYDTKVKNSLETNNYFITSQDASTICFYKQNKYGDTDLSTYEHDTSSDTKQTVPKGTSLAQLALKSFEGFKYYTAVQSGDTLNVYYNRLLVSYEFYSSKTDGKHLYNFSGLYDTSVTSPSYITDSDYYFICWKDIDGNALGTKYGADNKVYYPEVLSKAAAIGTKGVADTKGDILLDDGSVISYSDFINLTNKTSVINHAYAVLVCTDYNSNYTTSAETGDNIYTILENEKTKLFSGKQKLIAAVYKDDFQYKNVPWISKNELYLAYPFSKLNNWLDGFINTDYIKSIKVANADYSESKNAFSACETYGKNYAASTANTDEWYLPSLGELYALHLLLTDNNYSALKTNFYLSANGSGIWTSNTSPDDKTGYYKDGDNIEYYVLKAFYSNIGDSSTLKSDNEYRDRNLNVLPFRKIN